MVYTFAGTLGINRADDNNIWVPSIRNINAMYYPLCQLYLRPVARVSNGYFSGISEVVVIKIDAI